MIAFIKRYPFVLLVLLTFLYYAPSFFVFFSNDDWFHLRVSQIDSFSQFLNFFSFLPNAQSIPHYRPISTQVPFFLIQAVFGLQVFFFRFFLLGVFCGVIYSIYILVQQLTKQKYVAFISAFVYIISSTHFSRIYYFSTLQELLMTLFVLLALIFYIKKRWRTSFVFFILGLLSKETAFVTPLLLMLYELYISQFNYRVFTLNVIKKSKYILLFVVLSIICLTIRFIFFNYAIDGTYELDFSIKKMMNTGIWYGLWSFGVPEFLVDYVESGFKIVPKFFTDFPTNGYYILAGCLSVLILFGVSLFISFKKNLPLLSFALLFWVIGILPVLFLPWHKFTIELTLPLVGFSVFIAVLIKNVRYKTISSLFLVLFIILNVYTYSLYFERHYTIKRAEIAQRVFSFLEKNYPQYPNDSYFEFINDTADYGKEFGSSQQIAYAISRSEMVRVLYRNHSIDVFYEDYPEVTRPAQLKSIKLSTKDFLNK